MHFTTLVALAFTFVSAAHAKPALAESSTGLGAPIAYNISLSSDNFPVIKLSDSVQGAAESDTTLGMSGDPPKSPSLQEFPAALSLCQSFGCSDCASFDLSTTEQNVCLEANFRFVSGSIIQPSGDGLPFGVFVGPPGCATFDQIPVVNTCFNFDGPYTQVFLQP